MRTSRYSIAGLMGTVLIASLGLAALRDPSDVSEGWAGAAVMLVCGLFTLAVVGAGCSGTPGRIWWLGFALFGWGYLKLSIWPTFGTPKLPTMIVTEVLMTRLGRSLPQPTFGAPDTAKSFRQIGHCLWSLPFAFLGGTLAQFLFTLSMRQPEAPLAIPQRAIRTERSRWRWCRRIVFSLVGVGVALSVLIGASRHPGLFTGVTLLVTWGVIGVTALATVYNRGLRRARWLGATLFGAGYLLVVFGPSPNEPTWPQLAVDDSIRAFCQWIPAVERGMPASSPEIAAANARIREALEKPVPLKFPNATPLEDFIKYLRAATRHADDSGIPIVVDQIGLRDAEQTMQSPVLVEVEGVPLKRTLKLALRPLDMTYEIREGLLEITCASSSDYPYLEDPILPVAHLFLALLAAGVGALVAPLVVKPRGDVPRSADVP